MSGIVDGGGWKEVVVFARPQTRRAALWAVLMTALAAVLLVVAIYLDVMIWIDGRRGV